MGKVNIKPKKFNSGTGRIVVQLRVLAALAEDLGLGPNTHVMAYNRLYLQFQGNAVLSSAFCGPHIHMQYTYIHTGKICIQTKINKYIFKEKKRILCLNSSIRKLFQT